MTRRTDVEYEKLADEFEAGDFTVTGPVAVYPERLRTGRPAGGKGRGGNTPAISVRFPSELRSALDDLAAAESTPVAEVIRRAVADYVATHPV